MTPPATLWAALRHAAEAAPDRALVFPGDDGADEALSYATLHDDARRRAAGLRARGVRAGDSVLVVMPSCAELARTLFGIVGAGAVASIVAPPAAFGDIDGYATRLLGMARYLGARRIVTTGSLVAAAARLPGLEALDGATLDGAGETPGAAHGPESAAYIQCTSGSTGQPKGVVLPHRALLANVTQIGHAVGVRGDDVVVCWLPLHHDMGLIGCLLFALRWGLRARFFSPQQFLRRPVSWLRAVHVERASLSPAPNFAYGYAAARVKDEELGGLDLSCWRVAFCGAEPIDRRTLERFTRRFAEHGLGPDVILPCYGLAEATLAVTFHATSQPVSSDRLVRAELVERGVARDASPSDPTAAEIVSCGRPLQGTRVRVVGQDGSALADDRVGQVEVAGPTLMIGYHGLPHETRDALRDGWLRTGDLGYLRDGALRLTGRVKDLIIVRGVNHLPSDFEWAAEEVAGVRKGGVVAFGVSSDGNDTEALCLLCETDLEDEASRAALIFAIKGRVAARTEVVPESVVLVAKGTLPKTSSGKLQRALARARHLGEPSFP